MSGVVTPRGYGPSGMAPHDDDPVPLGIMLDLDEALRVLDALEESRPVLRTSGVGLGLQDELVTVIRILHGRLGFDDGGVP